MTDDTISPLRRRMIEDMTVRGFTACTQRGYIAAVRRFTVFLGRSPDQATAGPNRGLIAIHGTTARSSMGGQATQTSTSLTSGSCPN